MTYISRLSISTLEEHVAAKLGRPISLNELEAALKLTSKGKSPGPDGISPEFMLHFLDDCDTDCANYQPVYLIDLDMKLYAKLLASDWLHERLTCRT